MKIPKNINQKMRGVAKSDRVFIYNAAIIIEFLNSTFMPTVFFLNFEGRSKIGPGIEIRPPMMNNPDLLEYHAISIGQMYDYYKMFREQKEYTAEIETRYKFGLIIKKLTFTQNGWQFNVKRKGRAQINMVAPAMLRVKATAEDRSSFPVGEKNLSRGVVEVTPEDFQDMTYDVKVNPIGFPMFQVDEGPIDSVAIDPNTERVQARNEDGSIKPEIFQPGNEIHYTSENVSIGIDIGHPEGDSTAGVVINTETGEAKQLTPDEIVALDPGLSKEY